MGKQTDIRGEQTGVLKRLLSEKRGHGDPYIRGETRNKESFINVGEAAFTTTEKTLTIFTDVVNPKIVIATPSGTIPTHSGVVWALNTKGRTSSGSYIDITRGDGSTSAMPVSVLVVGIDTK